MWKAGDGMVVVDQDIFNISWIMDDNVKNVQGALQLRSGVPTALFLHGAGQTQCTFAATFMHLKKLLGQNNLFDLNIVSMDLRGHGLSSTCDDFNLDKDILVNDVINVLTSLTSGHSESHFIYLVGHSMGGAIACWIAQQLIQSSNSKLKVEGLYVMDIVEELALESLEHSYSMISKRPTNFPSLDDAIAWSLSAGYIQNGESATYSVPAQLNENNGTYTWKTDLTKTFSHWKGWFEGMSELFVKLKLINKVILLAGTDRLDKTMMIGQMQGKFKLVVFSQVKLGHFVHEDAPEKTACSLYNFFARKQIFQI